MTNVEKALQAWAEMHNRLVELREEIRILQVENADLKTLLENAQTELTDLRKFPVNEVKVEGVNATVGRSGR